jgi:hypothetical protein
MMPTPARTRRSHAKRAVRETRVSHQVAPREQPGTTCNPVDRVAERSRTPVSTIASSGRIRAGAPILEPLCQSLQQTTAAFAVERMATKAMREWSAFPSGDVNLVASINSILEAADRVNAGDMGGAEAMLTAQAVALNALFGALAHHRSRASTWSSSSDT